MKKKKIVSVLLIALTLFEVFAFAIPTIVNAASSGTLSHPKVPDVWYTRRGGGKPYMSAQYETYSMDGKVVYCIEPGIDITTTSYLGYDGLQASPYSAEISKKIELIGHYGYDYPGHQTLRYRMAAQALIWETTGGQIVEFWTQASGYGDYINIDAEKNEIMRLVNSHYNKMINDGFNQANIKSKLYNQATVNVMQKVKQNVKVKVINQFVSPKTYFNYLKNEVIVVKDLMFVTEAEKKYMAVLAAEILSRYAYLQYFANMSKSLKMNLVRGTSSQVDLVAAKIVAKYGQNILTKVVKLNFTNTKRVKALLKEQ